MLQEFKLPDLGEGIHEGEILAVHVSEGDEVKEGDIIFLVETDKAAVEIPSPYTGRVEKIQIKPHDVVAVGQVMIAFQVEKGEQVTLKKKKTAAESSTTEKQAVAKKTEVSGKKNKPIPASPATRRLARELGVNLNEIPATGAHGLVTAEDVRVFADSPHKAPKSKQPSQEADDTSPLAVYETSPNLPDFSKWGEVERLPLRSVRKAIAKKMALSWSQIPHVAHQDEADITELEILRQQSKAEVETHGGKLTLTIFALKAAVGALEKFPRFNSSLDLEHEEIALKKYYNLGIATDTERGLVVPIIRDVNKKNMMELAVELPHLSQKARDGKLNLDELSGGTFTITNIGSIGGRGFQPIINFPEVAILGLGRAKWQPVVQQSPKDGHKITARLMIPLVLAFDHRVIDGAEAARFVNEVKKSLETPARMLFQE